MYTENPIKSRSSKRCNILCFTVISHYVNIINLLTYLLATFAVKINNCPRWYVGPGGIGVGGIYPNCTGGAVYSFDVSFLRINHIFKNQTCAATYKTGDLKFY